MGCSVTECGNDRTCGGMANSARVCQLRKCPRSQVCGGCCANPKKCDNIECHPSFCPRLLHVVEDRRRMVSGPSSTLPTTGGSIAAPAQDGIPTCIWLVAFLALAFMVYWFVVRRFIRADSRPRFSPDLEAGLPREGLHLAME